MLAGRVAWKETAMTIRRMREWILQTEAILSGEGASEGPPPHASPVAAPVAPWMASLDAPLPSLDEHQGVEHACLAERVRISRSVRPPLLHGSEVQGLPRTKNDREGSIRTLNTRDRRGSGRKNGKHALVRSGQSMASVAWWQRTGISEPEMVAQLRSVDRQKWRTTRARLRQGQSDRVAVFRFRHKRETFLKTLEARWECTFSGTELLH